MYSDADEILQEEINQYKVRKAEHSYVQRFATLINLLVTRELQKSAAGNM